MLTSTGPHAYPLPPRFGRRVVDPKVILTSTAFPNTLPSPHRHSNYHSLSRLSALEFCQLSLLLLDKPPISSRAFASRRLPLAFSTGGSLDFYLLEACHCPSPICCYNRVQFCFFPTPHLVVLYLRREKRAFIIRSIQYSQCSTRACSRILPAILHRLFGV